MNNTNDGSGYTTNQKNTNDSSGYTTSQEILSGSVPSMNIGQNLIQQGGNNNNNNDDAYWHFKIPKFSLKSAVVFLLPIFAILFNGVGTELIKHYILKTNLIKNEVNQFNVESDKKL